VRVSASWYVVHFKDCSSWSVCAITLTVTGPGESTVRVMFELLGSIKSGWDGNEVTAKGLEFRDSEFSSLGPHSSRFFLVDLVESGETMRAAGLHAVATSTKCRIGLNDAGIASPDVSSVLNVSAFSAALPPTTAVRGCTSNPNISGCTLKSQNVALTRCFICDSPPLDHPDDSCRFKGCRLVEIHNDLEMSPPSPSNVKISFTFPDTGNSSTDFRQVFNRPLTYPAMKREHTVCETETLSLSVDGFLCAGT